MEELKGGECTVPSTRRIAGKNDIQRFVDVIPGDRRVLLNARKLPWYFIDPSVAKTIQYEYSAQGAKGSKP